MSIRLLKPVTKASQRVLEQLVADLDVGDSRRIDRGLGFMPVHIECLHRTDLGPLFSIAHYFEQNGDLVPDPDVVFLRDAGGAFHPVSFQNSLAYRVAVRFDEDGIIEVDEREQRDLVDFCNCWIRNIQEQQGLPGSRG